MADTTSVGTLLRGWRQAAGLTLEGLSEVSGVAVRTIGDLERGRIAVPQRRTVAALAQALGLSESDRQALAGRGPAPLAGGTELPRSGGVFVGRDAEVERIAGLAAGGGVVVVSGPAGVGKTTLALHCARLLADDFPDGVHHVHLRGMSDDPMPPGEAQARVLRALGVTPGRVPAEPEARSVMYRDVVRVKRAVLVFDDVTDEDQVRPLLPGETGTLTVVTSRRHLNAVPAAGRVPLDLLTVPESVHLLAEILDEGTDFDAETAAEVARLCGYLPLALRITGNRLLSRAGWGLPQLVRRLADEERRLGQLHAGDVRVTTAFMLSYRQLSPEAARVFRRLALVPGADAGPGLAGVLAGYDPDTTEDALNELVELGLVQSPAPDRFGFHDLVRLFARDRLHQEEPRGERDAAADRMTGWLLTAVREAGRWFENTSGTPGPGIGDRDDAHAWLRAESDNWLAALRTAYAAGRYPLVVEVVEAMHWFSDLWIYWPHWPEVFMTGRDAARAAGDRVAEATQTNYVAWVHTALLRDQAAALREAHAAARIAEEAGSDVQHAWAWTYAGSAELQLGRYPDAATSFARSAELFSRTTDYDGRVQAELGLGDTLQELGEPEAALVHLRIAVGLLDDPGIPMVEGHRRFVSVHTQVSIAAADRRPETIAAAQRAIDAYLKSDVRYLIAPSMIEMGRVLRETGDPDGARRVLRRAEGILREHGDEIRLARVLTELETLAGTAG